MRLPKFLARMATDFFSYGPVFLFLGILSKFNYFRLLKIKISGIGFVYFRCCSSDFGVIRDVLKNKCYSLPPFLFFFIQKKYERILSCCSVPLIIDAGANIGTSALFLNKIFPEAHILAFEPDKSNFDVAELNISSRNNIFLFNKAVGGSDGFVNIFPEKNSVAITTSRSNSGISVSTIDSAIKDYPKGELFLAKIDIEGFENDLFSNNLGWLDQVACVILEPHDWRFPATGTSATFQKAFGDRNFGLFIFGENLLYVRRDLFY